MGEEESIELLELSRIIDDFIKRNRDEGWYAPELAQVIIDNDFRKGVTNDKG
jgi:hypothetical protein